MSSKATTTQLDSILQNVQGTLINLYGRWLDESEYEDINDYKQCLDPLFAQSSAKIIRMNKKPFGCNFTINDTVGTFRLKINSRQIAVEQVA